MIHNPETILLGFMQDESEGAKEATPLLNVAWTKASVPDGLFLSPGGMPIGLTGLTELALLKSAESGIDSRTVLKSVLYGFAKGEQRYFANFNGGRFTGYFLEGTTSEKEVFTDTEGVTKKLVQSGRYDITLLGIDGEAPTTRQVDNNLWYDQPDWSNYTAQGTQITIVDDFTFMPCGSLLRQYKDSPLMESHVLKTAILNNPCVLSHEFFPFYLEPVVAGSGLKPFAFPEVPKYLWNAALPDYIGWLDVNTSEGYEQAIQIAFLCGLIDGLGNQVEAVGNLLPELCLAIADDRKWDEMCKSFEKLKEADLYRDLLKKVKHDYWGNENPYEISYKYGLIAIDVVTTAIGVVKTAQSIKAAGGLGAVVKAAGSRLAALPTQMVELTRKSILWIEKGALRCRDRILFSYIDARIRVIDPLPTMPPNGRVICVLEEVLDNGEIIYYDCVDMGDGQSFGLVRKFAKTGGTGKVWDDIIPTQPLYDANSLINKSFEINVGNNKIWVHGNATEHLRELELNILKDISKTPAAKKLSVELILSDFQGALKEATKNGIKYDEMISVGRWEFKFSAPRETGQLPALIHAQPK